MKKPHISPYIVLTLIFVAFTAGVFLGRNYNRGDILITTVETKPAQTESSAAHTEASPAYTAQKSIVNINTATVEELMTLPEIGQVYAEKIIQYRIANGPFQTCADLLNITGIGPSRLEAILDFITVGG